MSSSFWSHIQPRAHDYTLELLSPSPSTSVLLPHLPGIVTTPDQFLQFGFSVLLPLETIVPLDKLISRISGFQLLMHFPGFFIFLSLGSGQVLLLFSSITVPVFTIFPSPATDFSFPNSWTFRTVPCFCYHKNVKVTYLCFHLRFIS